MPKSFYDIYIRSPAWAEVRKRKFEQVGRRCQECGETERLEVHHLTYDRLGKERLEDLQALCHWCHSREHGHTPRVGPIAGLTADDLTRRGVGPALLQQQRKALASVVLAAFADETEALAQTMQHKKAAKLTRQAAQTVRAASRASLSCRS